MTQMDSSRRTGVVGALDRRTLLSRSAAGAMALAAPAILRSSPARAQAKVVNISGYGGVVNEYLTKLFGIPFEKKTGIKVNFGSNASLALAKLQATSGGPAQWDLISLTGNEYYVAIDQKLIVPYDYSIINTSHVQPEYKLPYGIKFSLFLFVMAWDQRQIPDDKAPQSWAEFWDTSRFKGKRSLYANISDGCTLECALLADGVPLDKLYPLDVNRALRSLERLGRDNIIWYNTNQEPIQQLTSGAVGLANAFDGRVILANRAGGTLGFTPAYGGGQRQRLLRQRRVRAEDGSLPVSRLHAERGEGGCRVHGAVELRRSEHRGARTGFEIRARHPAHEPVAEGQGLHQGRPLVGGEPRPGHDRLQDVAVVRLIRRRVRRPPRRNGSAASATPDAPAG
ncbi:MAG: extracellular solute-binding protein [Acetobacteraceae bacterium]